MKTIPKYASKTKTELWKNINWNKVKKNVRLLQERIAKALAKRQYRKVKSLQSILLKSFSAKLLAVKKITQNKGKKTPGIDSVIWKTSASKWEAAKNLNIFNYKAKPLRRISIPKSNGKKRNLGIPTMKDRTMQTLFLLSIEPISETTADWNSYGFRPNRSCADAIEQCQSVFAGKYRAEWVLEADIKGCFDHISHNWLLENIPIKKKILKQWLKSGYVKEGKWFSTQEGTPQGGIISPTLANMALDGLESLINQLGGLPPRAKYMSKKNKYKIHFVRYADDFIITSNNREFLERKIKPKIVTFLKERGLTLSEEKTKITHINEGFDFLGKNIRKYKDKLLIKPAKKSFIKISKKIKETIAKYKAINAYKLILILNPIIRGWVNYHKQSVASRIFSDLDHIIFEKIWKWCCRRHNNKSKQWIKDKYFKRIGNKDWCFFDENNNKIFTLIKAQSTRIIRHIKIKNDANPFDKSWKSYFKVRKYKLKCRMTQ